MTMSTVLYPNPGQHWVVGKPEPPGQFTVQVVGLPELSATAATREQAMQQVRTMLNDWIAKGMLTVIDVPVPTRRLLHKHLDPNDPLEIEYLEELARMRREDMERSAKEGGWECPNSSSTPTT